MVLPARLAPAASSASPAGAYRAAGDCTFSQSGLPPPVCVPATSMRSLTAKVRPSSDPDAVGARPQRGPEMKAPKSARPECAIEPEAATANLSHHSFAERGHHRFRIGDEAETFLHVPDRGFGAEVRRGRAAAVFHQDAAIP